MAKSGGDAGGEDGQPGVPRRRSSLNFLSKNVVPKPIKKGLGVGKYSKAKQKAAEAAEEARLAALRAEEAIAAKEAAEAAERALAQEVEQLEEKENEEENKVDDDEIVADQYLMAAAADRLYRIEEIEAAAGARAAAAAFAARYGVEEEEPSAKCFPTLWKTEDEEAETDGEGTDEEKASYWSSFWKTPPVDPDDPYAAYEVLVGDDEDPIEKHEWVLATSYEKVMKDKETGEGTVEQELVAMKFRFEHGFVITVQANELETKTRRIKLPEPTKLICIDEFAAADTDGDGTLNESEFYSYFNLNKKEDEPAPAEEEEAATEESEEEEEEEEEDEEEEEEPPTDVSEEGHPVGAGKGLLQRFWKKEEDPPAEAGPSLLERFWKKGEPEPEPEFKIGDRVEARGLFDLDFNGSWRPGTVVQFTTYVPPPEDEEEDKDEFDLAELTEFQIADTNGDGKISRRELDAFIQKKEAHKKAKEEAKAKAAARFIKKPLIKLDKWDEVYEFDEVRKLEEQVKFERCCCCCCCCCNFCSIFTNRLTDARTTTNPKCSGGGTRGGRGREGNELHRLERR